MLEWFHGAYSLTTAFYQADSRLLTKRTLIDDNGDGKASPAEWFHGLRATSKAKDNTPLGGATAQRTFLTPDAATQKMTATQLAQRDELEAIITTLRAQKTNWNGLRRLAELYP